MSSQGLIIDKPLDPVTDFIPPHQMQAEMLANDIIDTFSGNTDSHVFLTIEGERGSGKTTFLKAFEEKISDFCLHKIWITPKSFPETGKKRHFAYIAYHMAKEIESHTYSIVREMNDRTTSPKEHINNELIPIAKKIVEHARKLMLDSERSAEAAIAFAADTEDYVRLFAEGLGATAAPKTFIDEVKNWIDKAKTIKNDVNNVPKKALLLIIDDADWDTGDGELLRCLSLLGNIDGLILVVAGDREWLYSQVKRNIKLMTFTEPSETIPTEIRRAFLGHEVALLGWSSSRQIAFFDRPNPYGKMIWSWFCGFTTNTNADPNDEEAHKDFITELIIQDFKSRRGITNELIFNGFDHAYSWEFKYINNGNTVQELIANYNNSLKNLNEDDILELSARQNMVGFLLKILPSNARELVDLTNHLIRMERAWSQGKSVNNFDFTFSIKDPADRRARLLTHLGINIWRGSALEKMLSSFAWDFRIYLTSAPVDFNKTEEEFSWNNIKPDKKEYNGILADFSMAAQSAFLKLEEELGCDSKLEPILKTLQLRLIRELACSYKNSK